MAAFCAMVFAGYTIQRDIESIFNVPSFIVCFGGMISLTMADYGVIRQSRAMVLMCRALFQGDEFQESVDELDARVAHGMIACAYLAGATGFVIGLVHVFTHLDDAASMRCGLAIGIYCPLYALVLAMVLLHPATRRLEESVVK
jgi:flagellar motor component MotA